MAQTLHNKAQEYAQAANRAASGSRSAEGEGASALARTASALSVASRHCNQAAVALAGASREGQAYVERTVGSASTANAVGIGTMTGGLSKNELDAALTTSQSEFIGAEFGTAVGSAFYYGDDVKFRDAAKDVPSYPGEYVLDLHGTPTSVQLVGSDGELRELDAHQFADVVRKTTWAGQPIRLFSCDTGKLDNGFAQQLANELGVSVTAPTTPVSTMRDCFGRVYAPIVSDLETVWSDEVQDYVYRPVAPPTGVWREYPAI